MTQLPSFEVIADFFMIYTSAMAVLAMTVLGFILFLVITSFFLQVIVPAFFEWLWIIIKTRYL